MTEGNTATGEAPPAPTTVSKDDSQNAISSPASHSSEKIWVQSVEDKKHSGQKGEDYEQYETTLKKEDVETGRGAKKEEEAKRASFASNASSDSSGSEELAALKREMTVRKSRMDIETLTLMAKLERKKRKQRQRMIGLGVFLLVVAGVLGALYALM